jgi:hypothetical protein
MSHGDNDTTIYATGNGVKLDDLKAVLGQDIVNRDLKPTEIQDMPICATEDKIRRCFEAVGGADVCCEETSFGTGDELATFIKQIVDACEKNGGDLHNVWKCGKQWLHTGRNTITHRLLHSKMHKSRHSLNAL